MQFIRGIHNLRASHRGCVASIGNFDGVHRGHQAIIQALHDEGSAHRVPLLVITFEPHPQEYFRGHAAPPRLMSLREKLEAFRRYDVARVLCLRFNRDLADMSAEDFVTGILVAGLDVKYLLVGDDFRFGRNRQGDFASLTGAAQRHGFVVARVPTFSVDDQRVSSSRIRKSLLAGDLDDATRLLGRRYAISGRVAPGARRGREWGYPTANIDMDRRVPPLAGIFAVEVDGIESVPLPGVASLGTRPVVDGTQRVLEVHLFDFDADIYGRHIRVQFVRKLRDERDFESVDALKVQIGRDVEIARSMLESRS